MATPSLAGQGQFQKRVGATLSKIRQTEFARGGVALPKQTTQALLEGSLEQDRMEKEAEATRAQTVALEQQRIALERQRIEQTAAIEYENRRAQRKSTTEKLLGK